MQTCATYQNETNFLSSAELSFSNVEDYCFFFRGIGSRRGKNVGLKLVKQQHSLAREAKHLKIVSFFRIKKAPI